MVQIFLMLDEILTEDSEVEDYFSGALSGSEPSLFCRAYLIPLKFKLNSKDTSGTGRIRTQSPSQTSKGKTDKHIFTNNRITDGKPS